MIILDSFSLLPPGRAGGQMRPDSPVEIAFSEVSLKKLFASNDDHRGAQQ